MSCPVSGLTFGWWKAAQMLLTAVTGVPSRPGLLRVFMKKSFANQEGTQQTLLLCVSTDENKPQKARGHFSAVV
jgi:hypothetical protein